MEVDPTPSADPLAKAPRLDGTPRTWGHLCLFAPLRQWPRTHRPAAWAAIPKYAPAGPASVVAEAFAVSSADDTPVRQSVTATSASADASTATEEPADFTAQLAALLQKFDLKAESAAVRRTLAAIGADEWVCSDCGKSLRQETLTEEICGDGGSAVCCSRYNALDVHASPPGLTLEQKVQQLLARNRDLAGQLNAYKMAQPSILFGESEGGRWCAARCRLIIAS